TRGESKSERWPRSSKTRSSPMGAMEADSGGSMMASARDHTDVYWMPSRAASGPSSLRKDDSARLSRAEGMSMPRRGRGGRGGGEGGAGVGRGDGDDAADVVGAVEPLDVVARHHPAERMGDDVDALAAFAGAHAGDEALELEGGAAHGLEREVAGAVER